MDFRDQVVIVTGGAGVIGTGISLAFHQLGAHVVIVGRSAEKIETAYDLMGVPPDERVAITGDVGKEELAERMVREALERFGRLDHVVTCVYSSAGGNSQDITMEQWDQCIAVTLTSTFLAARHGVPAILETAGRGSIIAISSVHGSHPGRHYAMYATAKAGLEMLVRALALDHTAQGVRVNAVAPGNTVANPEPFDAANETGVQALYPIDRYLSPADIANAVVFLASEESEAITGQTITVDGGSVISEHHWLLSDINRRWQKKLEENGIELPK